jgi:methyltransferase (TIGR00027 family)
MEPQRASDTAAFTAMLRAAHQLIDAQPKILDDPISIGLTDEAAAERIAARRSALLSPNLMVPRAAVVLRSRYAEDLLAQAVEQRVSQFVILGAGMDTFAYRQPAYARSLQIYEVDHPATQAWKRERLAKRDIVVPGNLCWAPVDLEHQDLIPGLQKAGFDASRRAFFSWLGVVQYLTWSAIELTLRAVATLPSPSTIVLSFMLPDDGLTASEAAAARAIAEEAAKKGEPWLTRIQPSDLANRLSHLGFKEINHLSPADAHARYFAGRQDDMRAPHVAQMMSATN